MKKENNTVVLQKLTVTGANKKFLIINFMLGTDLTKC